MKEEYDYGQHLEEAYEQWCDSHRPSHETAYGWCGHTRLSITEYNGILQAEWMYAKQGNII